MAIPTRGGALWLENWILGSRLASASNARQTYPAKNTLSPHPSAPWRSPNAIATAFLVYELDEPRLPECVALIGSNLDGGVAIRFRGSDDVDQLANAVFWDLPLYRQDRVGRVMRWYLPDAPTSGTAGPRRYWGVRILPATFGSYNTAEDYYEIGVVWLGEYTAIRPWSGIRIRARSSGRRNRVGGNVQWAEDLPAYREADVPIGGLTVPELDALEVAVRAHGPRHALLDLHAFSADPEMKRGGCLYGTFPAEAFDGELRSPEANVATLSFVEAAG